MEDIQTQKDWLKVQGIIISEIKKIFKLKFYLNSFFFFGFIFLEGNFFFRREFIYLFSVSLKK